MRCKCWVAIILVLSLFLFPLTGQEENLVKGKTLVVGLSSGEITYNPLVSYSSTEAQVYSALYEGLVTYHPFTLEPMPGVAQSWEISPDGRTYRFHLRQGALYWNGDPVTAEDFLETWLLLIDPDRNAPYSFLLDGVKGAKKYRTGVEQGREKVGLRAENESTFVVELTDPSDPFLKILCHHAFVPLHPKVRELIVEGSDAPGLGNGPFYLYETEPGMITFIKNELYWDAPEVDVKKIRLLTEDDPDEAARLFNQGKIHWSMGNITVADVENRQSVALNPLFATTYYYFSTRQEPFEDSRVRRALALLLPWEQIRSEEIYYTPAPTLIPALSGYPEVTGLETTDREEAMGLLEEAGFPGGKGLPPIILIIPQGLELSPPVTAMKESWEEALETEVKVKSLASSNYYTALEEEEYTLGTLTWIGDFADPLTFLQMWASDSNLNSGGFHSEEYDALLEDASRQTGPTRMRTLAKAEELLLQQGAVLPISHQPALNVVDMTVLRGWFPNPLDIHPFKYLSFFIPELPPNVVQSPGNSPTIPKREG